MPRRHHRISRANITFAHDIAMAASSFLLSLYLRLGDTVFLYPPEFLLRGTATFALIAAAVFWWTGLYRGVWRYASLNDMVAIVKAVSLVVLIFLAFQFLATRLEDFPRSAQVINWFVLIFLLGGPRFVYRVLKDRGFRFVLKRETHPQIPVLLLGAGDGAETFIREMRRDANASYRVVGILSTKDTRVGRRIHDIDVMGGLSDLDAVVERLAAIGDKPQRMIVTSERIEGETVRGLLDASARHGIALSRMPRLTDFKSGVHEKLDVRPVDIEDLLFRPQTVLDRDAMRALIAGRRVMVTGAGGTIGSELTRQISDFAPAHLSLLDNSEFALYAIDRELAERHGDLSRSAVLADVRERARVTEAVTRERPDLVFHAAALKHVPMVEDHPNEGVLTNVIGTRNVADACAAAQAAAMVLISTDKAVNPTSVMGATKRLAESYCQARDVVARSIRTPTRFLTVRFGNVLGSTGSVVPLFQHQLAKGGPLTVTDPAMTRYFMTVREAVELVLQASALGAAPGDGGTEGRIFVLDMGEPVKILDLARQMIRLAGLRPDVDIPIVFTGIRPGEKLHEALFHDAEKVEPTKAKGIFLASPRAADLAVLSRTFDELEDAVRGGRAEQTLSLLARLVPEYLAALSGGAKRAGTAP
jgi:O-antigen biosynthesis protein WbqV